MQEQLTFLLTKISYNLWAREQFANHTGEVLGTRIAGVTFKNCRHSSSINTFN
jgi:hypothetical protein